MIASVPGHPLVHVHGITLSGHLVCYWRHAGTWHRDHWPLGCVTIGGMVQ